MAPRLQVSGSGTEWSGEEETGVNPLRRILPGEDVEVSPPEGLGTSSLAYVHVLTVATRTQDLTRMAMERVGTPPRSGFPHGAG